MSENSMAAVVQYALKAGAVELREVPVPDEPADDEVLLRTRAVGVCGSEIHQYHNTQSWRVNVPVILGHEFAGVVVRAGKAVRGFREGDRVASETAARICGQLSLLPQRRIQPLSGAARFRLRHRRCHGGFRKSARALPASPSGFGLLRKSGPYGTLLRGV